MQEQPHEQAPGAPAATTLGLSPASSTALVLITQAEYARRCNPPVSREAVRKWIARGMPMHEQGDGRKLVDQAEADLWRGVNVAQIEDEAEDEDDLAEDAPASGTLRPSLTAAKTETETYRARLAELQLNQQLGKLRPVEQVVDGARLCGETMLRAIGRIRTRADELFARSQKDGVFGMRAGLREIERDLRKVAAEAFAKLAAGELPAQIDDAGDDE
jgi:hypothetical protein